MIYEIIDDVIDKGYCEFKKEVVNFILLMVIVDVLGVFCEDMLIFWKWLDVFIV